MMRKIVLGVLTALLIVASVVDAETEPAENRVKTMVDRVLTALDREDLATAAKLDAIIDTITPVFDFPLMAKLTLGRTAWPKLSKEQQEEFTDLFVGKLRNVYARQVENFSGQTIEFEKAEERGGKVHLESYVRSRGDRISILYKLYKASDLWKIYDMEIQGVSIVSSYRAQFVPIIQERSPDALLQELRESLVEKDTE